MQLHLCICKCNYVFHDSLNSKSQNPIFLFFKFVWHFQSLFHVSKFQCTSHLPISVADVWCLQNLCVILNSISGCRSPAVSPAGVPLKSRDITIKSSCTLDPIGHFNRYIQNGIYKSCNTDPQNFVGFSLLRLLFISINTLR